MVTVLNRCAVALLDPNLLSFKHYDKLARIQFPLLESQQGIIEQKKRRFGNVFKAVILSIKIAAYIFITEFGYP